MVEYGGMFRDIMKYRYGKTEPTPQECELFKAVSYLGESFNNYNPPSPVSKPAVSGLNGKVLIKRKDYSDTDHLIVLYEGNDVFHITIGIADKITNYIPGDWEDKILKRYYEVHP